MGGAGHQKGHDWKLGTLSAIPPPLGAGEGTDDGSGPHAEPSVKVSEARDLESSVLVPHQGARRVLTLEGGKLSTPFPHTLPTDALICVLSYVTS